MRPLAIHFNELRAGGTQIVKRKVKTFIFVSITILSLFLQSFWAIPLILLVRMIRPFKLIQFQYLNFERIGHFAADVGQRKARDILNCKPSSLIYAYLPPDEKCSNAYWATITRRWFKVNRVIKYLIAWNNLIPFGSCHNLPSSRSYSRDLAGCLEQAKITLPATVEENRFARDWMRELGWIEGDPFVCLLVRDSEYLSDRRLDKTDFSYHSYRDSDVQTYTSAIDYLVSEKVWVFRMGKSMRASVNFNHPRFIDYAFRKDKSDFLDVWLFANCSLCITTGSGPDMISDIFRRPILAVNYSPLQLLWSWSNALHFPKILKWKESDQILSLTEYLNCAFLETEKYSLAGIQIVDLTADQILQTVKEAWGRITNTWNEDHTVSARNHTFWEILRRHPDFKKYHGYIHPEARVATNFFELTGDNFLR